MANAKSTAFASDVLDLIFNATGIGNIADDTATAPATTLTVALHTSTPGAGGTQSTNEISYVGYTRVAVARTSGGWTVGSATISPVADIDFGEMTGGAGGTVTHFSIGTGVSNAMLYFGTVAPNIVVTTGVVPRLTTNTAVTED